jgi:hypothetical protein
MSESPRGRFSGSSGHGRPLRKTRLRARFVEWTTLHVLAGIFLANLIRLAVGFGEALSHC